MLMSINNALTWILPRQPFPSPTQAWVQPNGLLCASETLDAERLLKAYAQGIFPWYSPGEPVLWWCPNPRMVLTLSDFKLHRSLRKTLQRVGMERRWQLSLDRAFKDVMRACAQPRDGQSGSWISEDIISAYGDLHLRGHAHSLEVWEGSQLVAGLYGVSLGRMFFGESMFTLRNDASKLALLSLVHTLRNLGFSMIDCQQNTRHLASMGAAEISRSEFLERISDLMSQSAPHWHKVCDPEGYMPWPLATDFEVQECSDLGGERV
jgi:leucyl/phenylalanyl-tRNA---protein transferase